MGVCGGVFVYPAMRLIPLQPIGMKLGMELGGKGLIFQKNFAWSPEVKCQVKFQAAQMELIFGEGDASPMVSAKCVSRRMHSKVK